MRSYVIDSNVIVRYLVGDNKKQQEQAEQWFRDAEKGAHDIIVYPLVIAETCFVLESYYTFSRDRIADRMEVFLSQRWLEVVERDALLDVWQSYRDGMHFVDSYLIASSKESGVTVLTFDKKLKSARARHRSILW